MENIIEIIKMLLIFIAIVLICAVINRAIHKK